MLSFSYDTEASFGLAFVACSRFQNINDCLFELAKSVKTHMQSKVDMIRSKKRRKNQFKIIIEENILKYSSLCLTKNLSHSFTI